MFRHTLCHTSAACALILLACATAQAGFTPKCTDKDKAQTLDTEAGQSYDAGRFAEAIAAWKGAYAACQNPTSLWNVARSYENLGELLQAQTWFRLHQNFPGLPSERLAAGTGRLDVIEMTIADWSLLKQQADAASASNDCKKALPLYNKAQTMVRTPEVMLNTARCQQKVGQLDAAIATLNTHVSFASINDIESAQARKGLRQISAIQSAKATKVSDKASAPVAISTASDDDAGFGLKVAGWGTAGVGVALLATGTAFALQSGGNNTQDADNNDPRNDGRRGGDPPPQPDDNNNDGGGLDPLSTGLIITGGAAVLTGVTLLVLGYNMEAEPEAGPVETVRIDLGLGTVGVSGEW